VSLPIVSSRIGVASLSFSRAGGGGGFSRVDRSRLLDADAVFLVTADFPFAQRMGFARVDDEEVGAGAEIGRGVFSSAGALLAEDGEE
jgi:hypothetical protein